MSDAQVANVAESWGKAYAAWGTEGSDFFASLFEADADVYAKFADYFGGACPVATAKASPKMKAQADAFGNMVNDWVSGYGKPAGDARIKAFSTSHKARGISKAQVERAFNHLAGYMKKFGGDAAAWGAVAGVILGKMEL